MNRTARSWIGGIAALGMALLAASCAKNPLASTTPGASSTTFNRPQELLFVQNNPALGYLSGMFFAPQLGSPTNSATLDFTKNTAGGFVYQTGFTGLSYGGDWTVDQGAGIGNPPNFVPAGSTGQSTTDLYLLKGDSFSNNLNDVYTRWHGEFFGTRLPNPNTDYDSLEIMLTTANGPGEDISRYHGFSFWARGTGNFAVNLVSGSTSTGQTGPYLGYNYYLQMFNTDLSANPSEWKQVTVYFDQMVQTYGTSTNQVLVLQNFYGLLFNQQPPINLNYTLDVDYIRFF